MCAPCANPPQPMIPTRRRLFAPRTLVALAAVATIEAAEADTKVRRLILLAFSIAYLVNEFKLRRRAVYKVVAEIASVASGSYVLYAASDCCPNRRRKLYFNLVRHI
jgi:hypothetical protein